MKKQINLEKKGKSKETLLNVKYSYKPKSSHTLRLKGVKKNFGSKKVLKGVNFSILKGERVSLVGKNGSGKSTLINILSQQLRMSEGSISYGYAKNRVESLELMGIQFQTLNYPEGFVVRDVIHFFNVSVEKEIRMSVKELEDMVSMFGIDKFYEQKIDRLSGGQQQRINILLALIKKPRLLILDEISTGLDVESAETIKEYIEHFLKINPETSLLLVSHSDEEIREMTDRVILLEGGKIVEEFPSKKLTPAKFLKIIEREPKLTKDEVKNLNEQAEKDLSKLKKYYNVKKPSEIRNKFNKFLNEKFYFIGIKKPSEIRNKFNKFLNEKFYFIDNSLMDEENLIEIRDISKTYGKTVGAVRNLNLDIVKGSRIAITGPNGSGKTTIVEMIARVKSPDSKNKKFNNKLNLAKIDFKRQTNELEEEVNSELRKFKNGYRLKSELIQIEISDLKKSIPKLQRDNVKKLNEENKDFIVREQNKKIKTKIESKIKNLENELEIFLEKQKKKYLNLEANLNKNLEINKSKLRIEFDNEYNRILEERDSAKKTNNLTHIKSFIKNGKILPAIDKINDKPLIAYSFSNTSRGVKDETGVQFQYASFPVEMSVLDVILFFSRTNKNFMSKDEIINAVKVFKLEKLLKTKAYKLSGGERQRLNVLLAIMKSPKLLILDEISTGLDVDSILKIDNFIKDYLNKTGATLILISHNYHEVHSLTDRIVVMRYGELSEIVDTKGWSLKQTKNKMRDIYKGGGI